jgi:soluble lytic murein transglycosylase-like protein
VDRRRGRNPRLPTLPQLTFGGATHTHVSSLNRVPRLTLAVAAVVLVAALVAGVLARSDSPSNVPVIPTPPGEAGESSDAIADPFAWDPRRAQEFSQRAAAGNSHVLYALSPGGVVASAARTARWRPLVDRAAEQAGVDPNALEALVFLESAGREDARAPGGLEAAAGLTQILAETGQNLLKMHIDLAASTKLTKRLAKAERRGRPKKAERLRRARAQVDDRFDPAKALAATGRYLTIARRHFGREDLAFVSYHMGIGNLDSVLRDYGAGAMPYVQVYFDSTPTRHPAAYSRLAAFGDDSSNYWWKILAAEEIMRLYRADRPQLVRLAALHAAKASAEEVLHPLDRTRAFVTPADLRKAWNAHQIVPFPQAEAVTGLRRDPRMGELDRRLHQPPGLYRGLRPEALAMALYIGAEVRAISGQSPLIVTSTVRDGEYQAQLIKRNGEATRGFSLHTTGWAFDVERRYTSRRQALAFQFVLDRLRSLNAIAWVREPHAIHITVGADTGVPLALLERVNIKAP